MQQIEQIIHIWKVLINVHEVISLCQTEMNFFIILVEFIVFNKIKFSKNIKRLWLGMEPRSDTLAISFLCLCETVNER